MTEFSQEQVGKSKYWRSDASGHDIPAMLEKVQAMAMLEQGYNIREQAVLRGADIPNAKWPDIIAFVQDKLQKGEKLEFTQVKQLFARYLFSTVTSAEHFSQGQVWQITDNLANPDLHDHQEQDIKILKRQTRILHAAKQLKISFAKRQEFREVTHNQDILDNHKEHVVHDILFMENDIVDKLSFYPQFWNQTMAKALEGLDVNEKKQLVESFSPYFFSYFSNEFERKTLYKALLDDAKEPEERSRVEQFVYDQIHAQTVVERATPGGPIVSSQESPFASDFVGTQTHYALEEFVATLEDKVIVKEKVFYDKYIDYLVSRADFVQNFDTHLKSLGEILNPQDYVYVVDSVRKLYEASKKNPQKAQKLAKLGVYLLGSEDPENTEFFESLDMLYASIRFEGFVDTKILEHDARMVEALIESLRLDNPRLLEIGCGRGNAIKYWAEIVKNHNGSFAAIDIDKNHADASSETAIANGLSGSQVKCGSWYDLVELYGANSQDIVIARGRDVSHAETEENFQKIFAQVGGVLRPGGVFLFDIAEPSTGFYYKAGRDRFNRALEQNLAVPKEVMGAFRVQDMAVHVDGPQLGAEKLYNRFIPNERQTIALVQSSNYEQNDRLSGTQKDPVLSSLNSLICAKIGTSRIDGVDGVNNYYIAIKPDFGTNPQYAAIVDQIRQAQRAERNMQHNSSHWHPIENADKHYPDEFSTVITIGGQDFPLTHSNWHSAIEKFRADYLHSKLAQIMPALSVRHVGGVSQLQ